MSKAYTAADIALISARCADVAKLMEVHWPFFGAKDIVKMMMLLTDIVTGAELKVRPNAKAPAGFAIYVSDTAALSGDRQGCYEMAAMIEMLRSTWRDDQ